MVLVAIFVESSGAVQALVIGHIIEYDTTTQDISTFVNWLNRHSVEILTDSIGGLADRAILHNSRLIKGTDTGCSPIKTYVSLRISTIVSQNA